MDYTFLSSFETIFHHENRSIGINDYIKQCLQTETEYFVKTAVKNGPYTICLYDEYENLFWIYNEAKFANVFEFQLTFTITKRVEEYVRENHNVFRKRFLETRLYILNRLNKYDAFLFKTHLNEYYHIDNDNWAGERKYLNKLNAILNSALNQPMGSYLYLQHRDFFDELMYMYCKSKDRNATDAIVIVDYINILTR